MKFKFLKRFLLVFFLLFVFPKITLANPYFYIQGDAVVYEDTASTYNIRVDTDGNELNALQVVVNFDPDFFDSVVLGNTNSECHFWAPANSAPPGDESDTKKITPYINDTKAIFTCGFVTAINKSDGIIGQLVVTPKDPGETSFTFSDAVFTSLSTITPGAMANYNLIAIDLADATPTPEATTDPYASISAIPTPITNSTTLFDDVTVTDVTDNFSGSSGNTSTSSTGETISELDVVEEDDTVPAPPGNITPRPAATPYVYKESSYSGDINFQEGMFQGGEVMAGQSLRDLLIPGKSKADKTVVWINLISFVIFLVLLLILLWRLFVSKKKNNVKTRYLNDLVSGELSALGTKMEIAGTKEGKEKLQEEFDEAMDNILKGMGDKEESKKEK